MTFEKYTKPWRVFVSGYIGQKTPSEFLVTSYNGLHICTVINIGDETEVKRTFANLISAAPDLLEALYELVYDPEGKEWKDSEMSENKWDTQLSEAREKARLAIAKARGEA